jgi:hypothetical protein
MPMQPRYLLVEVPVQHDEDGEITDQGQEHLDSVVEFISANVTGKVAPVREETVEGALWLFED